jgi:hypothetical protein
MNLFWRALLAGALLFGTAVWVPAMANAASTSSVTSMRAPVGDDNDNEDKDNDNIEDNSNDNIEDNSNDNIEDNSNDNLDDNDNAADNANDNDGVVNNVPTDPTNSGAQVQNSDLTVDLWRSTDYPVVNTPFQLGVTGNGAPIERVWIWAEGPGGGPADDVANAGELSRTCDGAQPCAQNWQVVARNVGYYNIHARVRDTSGREVQTDWSILVSSNPRSG